MRISRSAGSSPSAGAVYAEWHPPRLVGCLGRRGGGGSSRAFETLVTGAGGDITRAFGTSNFALVGCLRRHGGGDGSRAFETLATGAGGDITGAFETSKFA